jgi:hypothetical protein
MNLDMHACSNKLTNAACILRLMPIDLAGVLGRSMVYMQTSWLATCCTWNLDVPGRDCLSMFYLQTLAGGGRCCQRQYARTRSMMAGLMDQLQSYIYRFVESRLDVHDTSFCTIAHTVYRVRGNARS